MAVVVDNCLVIELLTFDDKTGGSVGSVPYNLPDHIVHGNSGCDPGFAGIGTPVGSTAADFNLTSAECGSCFEVSSMKDFVLLHDTPEKDVTKDSEFEPALRSVSI